MAVLGIGREWDYDDPTTFSVGDELEYAASHPMGPGLSTYLEKNGKFILAYRRDSGVYFQHSNGRGWRDDLWRLKKPNITSFIKNGCK
ncbi:MAG TPA: hypothetical protein DHN29_11265 [Cytophagales bacterium]|nr:hypothetical protein [Cytophagales bacterium]|tara:strand:+ start:1048 stop:1311 length:264 start_codon:yes stop_codon:yes gene_type:complete